VARNVRVGRGELDIIAEHGGRRIAVEVKSAWIAGRRGRDDDALDAYDDAKATQVWSLAREVGAHRVDLVVVNFTREGVQVRWVPGAA
jgi:Holliday junction resolvase-like predicted endonuclease